MKPYYEHEGITIYHADCRIVLHRYPFTCVVSDPPYNIGYKYGDAYKDNLDESEYQALIASTLRPPSVVLHYPEDMFGVAVALRELPEKCAAWVYNAHTPRKWRMIAWFGISPDFSLATQPFKNPSDKRIQRKLDAGIDGCPVYDWWQDEQVKNVSDEKTDHPCQIPVEVMKRVLLVTPSDIILDPFMGSGTTLVAAKQLGRKAIGIEIEEKYCEIAAKRLAQGVLEIEA